MRGVCPAQEEIDGKFYCSISEPIYCPYKNYKAHKFIMKYGNKKDNYIIERKYGCDYDNSQTDNKKRNGDWNLQYY